MQFEITGRPGTSCKRLCIFGSKIHELVEVALSHWEYFIEFTIFMLGLHTENVLQYLNREAVFQIYRGYWVWVDGKKVGCMMEWQYAPFAWVKETRRARYGLKSKQGRFMLYAFVCLNLMWACNDCNHAKKHLNNFLARL